MKQSSLLDIALQGKPLRDNVLIIDFHVHLGQWAFMHNPSPDEKMLTAMDRVGVAMICVNGWVYPDARKGNDSVAEFARRFPDRVIPFACLNPYQNAMLDELKRCVEEFGMKGLKVHEAIQGQYSQSVVRTGYDWDAVWKYCGQHGLPVLAHGIVTNEDIRRNPETAFVIAHGINAPERLEQISAYPNAYIDTAATQNKAWSLTNAVNILGPDRVLWGTDAPLDDFAQRLGIVFDSGLSEEEQRNILGQNAARILELNL